MKLFKLDYLSLFLIAITLVGPLKAMDIREQETFRFEAPGYYMHKFTSNPFIERTNQLVEKSEYFTNIFRSFGQSQKIALANLNLQNDIGLQLLIHTFDSNTMIDDELLFFLKKYSVEVFNAIHKYQIKNIVKDGINILDILMPQLFNEYTHFIDDNGNYNDNLIININFSLVKNLQNKNFQNSFKNYMEHIFITNFHHIDYEGEPNIIENFTAIWRWVIQQIKNDAIPDTVAQLSYHEIKNLKFYDEESNEIRTFVDYINNTATLSLESFNLFPFWIDFTGIELEDYFLSVESIVITSLINTNERVWGDISFFGYKTLDNLFQNFSHNNNLIGLDIFENEITNLPDSIGTLQNLEELYLGSNQLTNLPESIRYLTQIKILDLSNNQLTLVPNSIENLTLLEILFLNENNLSVIPNYIGNLTNLRRLNIRLNYFSNLPETISSANLPNLEIFAYSSNIELSRKLPQSIIDLKNLGIAIEYTQDYPQESENVPKPYSSY